ncbi:MAG: HEPN domain-containing protein [Deltaproteobacteria bacterium]|nr:HEPN domain-containing protein [Deltaproteobacteria bacterium]
MTNPKLARDYLLRSQKRLKAVALLLAEESHADVVRESQEVVELLLKGFLRSFGVPVPFSYDLSEVLGENASRLPADVARLVPRWAEISKRLRKDRELAFYGSEDVTPSSFYTREDADGALAMAREVLAGVEPWIR